MLTDRLRLTADVAYLPLVNFTGLDSHNARELLLPETASIGDGVMLEAILGYNLSSAWNVGVGGRYWAFNTRDGTSTFNFLGFQQALVEPARYNSERYGVFVQSSYKWGDTAIPVKAIASAMAPMNWTGFYAGGHLGGGWSNDQWSDPFGSAPSGLGAVNIAGFGDTTRATGPLAGGQAGYDLQRGHAVFGVQADASAADLRGENTCFSGLGGVNCQRIVNALGTLTGRVGYAWDRTLGYLKAGGALASVGYNLNGNTNAIAQGTGSTSATTMGWTAGGGIEYALTDCWSTVFEYDHIGLSSASLAFPTVTAVNARTPAVQQDIDVVKLGINYRFNTAPVVANAAPLIVKY
jgi:opacity protein-like surface antigen